jgi:hypothetical protein
MEFLRRFESLSQKRNHGHEDIMGILDGSRPFVSLLAAFRPFLGDHLSLDEARTAAVIGCHDIILLSFPRYLAATCRLVSRDHLLLPAPTSWSIDIRSLILGQNARRCFSSQTISSRSVPAPKGVYFHAARSPPQGLIRTDGFVSQRQSYLDPGLLRFFAEWIQNGH